MATVTYASLKVEQAWLIVSEQLQQRNSLLSRSITQLERHPTELPVASHLMILRYHLRHSLRQLNTNNRLKRSTVPDDDDDAYQLERQWMHVRQLFFLLRQVDLELLKAKLESQVLCDWLESLTPRVYKSTLMHLN